MGKLSLLKPSIGTLANRLEPLPEERRRQYERTRRATTEWRAWYGTQRWKDLRQSILARDHYKCQITGVMLLGKYPAANSPVVDHKTPHRGDPDLFWDPNNLHAVSRDWHDTTKQAMERGGQATSHPEWFKPSLIPLTIVCGPPASGKSSYVAARAQQGDLIIDLDVIASTIAGTDLHNWDRDRYLNEALYRRNDIIGGLSRPSGQKAAWLIVSEPKAKWREWWQRKLKPIAIVVIETSETECVARVRADQHRPHKENIDGIVTWWLEYDRRPGETVISRA